MTGGKGWGGERAAQSVTLSFRHGSFLVWMDLNEGTVLHKRQTKQKTAIPEVPTRVAAVGFLGAGIQFYWEKNNRNGCDHPTFAALWATPRPWTDRVVARVPWSPTAVGSWFLGAWQQNPVPACLQL